MTPRRRVRIPVLIYCEGTHDQVFMRHLERTYGNRTSQTYFDIKHGDGGSPKSLVEKAAKMPGGYVHRIVVFDNDRGEAEYSAAEKVAKDSSVLLSSFSPCLESVLLGILEPAKDFSNMSATTLKKTLDQKYIKSEKRRDLQEYQRVFKKDLVDAARLKIPDLNEKIEILEQE